MKVRVLGTAAGGGLPQWNCACTGCEAARRSEHFRTQDCLAVSATGAQWWLVNASPDIRSQVLAAPELAPGPGRRQTPLRGVLMTSAELDHALGLFTLREGTDLTLYATAPVQAALESGLPVRSVLEPYAAPKWRTVVPGEPFRLDDRLEVTAVALGAKRPRYAASLPAGADSDWVIAYRFTDSGSGGVFVYAPCLADWTDAFDAALDGAGCALVDGTCFTDDEMTRATGTGRTSRQMGHLPIVDSLGALARHRGLRLLFTHLNNTNPVLDPGSPEHAAVRAAGAEVASDGMAVEL